MTTPPLDLTALREDLRKAAAIRTGHETSPWWYVDPDELALALDRLEATEATIQRVRELADHSFSNGICKDCGEVDKPAEVSLGAQVTSLESKVTKLTERNRQLENQLADYRESVKSPLDEVVGFERRGHVPDELLDRYRHLKEVEEKLYSLMGTYFARQVNPPHRISIAHSVIQQELMSMRTPLPKE